jgi:selenocysteine lyase/cysteine desulfurase
VAFTVEGATPSQVAKVLARRAVYVSDGDFYAWTIMQRLGLSSGVVRAGCACYTTENDVDALIAAVGEVAAGRTI